MPNERYGNYELIKRLATGGMAQIYLARQLGLSGFDKPQVIKRILPHLAEEPEFVRMFVNEARISARLNHPNIVQIFNLGAQGGTYFIAMEFVDGEDLRAVYKHCVAAQKRVPIDFACKVVMDAAAGLDYAHKKTYANGKPLGIVHRDVSPHNILVSVSGAVKVTDFGIAKAADQTHDTHSGVIKGKYAYMSPEQAEGEDVDCRTDIFALGVVLHELLTGKELFKKNNDVQTLRAVTEGEIPSPRKVHKDIPPSVEQVVMKALARDKRKRYQEAIQLQVALEKALAACGQTASPLKVAAFVQELRREREDRERARQSGSAARPHSSSEARPGEKRASQQSHRAQSSSIPSQLGAEPAIGSSKPGSKPPLISMQMALSALFGAALAAVIILAVLLFSSGTPDGAALRIDTQPPGARVVLDGALMPEPTPCVLPASRPGTYPLVLRLAGYREYRTTVRVPESGEVTLPVFKLEPEATGRAP